MCNIANHLRNANQNNKNEISPHTCQNGCHQKVQVSVWEDMGKGNTFTLLAGMWIVQLLWKTAQKFLKKLKIELCSSNLTEYPGYISRKKWKMPVWKDTCTQCSQQHYLQQKRNGRNASANQQLIVLRCNISIYLSIYLSIKWSVRHKKSNTVICHLQQYGWT